MAAGRFGNLCRVLFVLASVSGLSLADEDSTPYPVLSDNPTPDSLMADIQVVCGHNQMVVQLRTLGAFHGIVYPRGLAKKTPCMEEVDVKSSQVFTHAVPLRSCNTMFTDLEDGYVEYYNTIMVQPHVKLVTNQGRGYNIRCKYQIKDTATILGLDASVTASAAKLASATPLPATMMHIYAGNMTEHVTADHVKIGQNLTLVVELEQQQQPVFGMKVTDCSVRDGLGWGEQMLLNEQGCPIDWDVMGAFKYDLNATRASVAFRAHKFPYTTSVYYQCNVRLCLQSSNCDQPPECDAAGNDLRRRKRRAADGPKAEYRIDDPEFAQNATIEVYSGFYVADTTDSSDKRIVPGQPIEENDDHLCISPRDFAIGIAIAGLILMIAVIIAILFLCARRRHKRVSSTTASSVYSGPYTNTAYSHSS